MVLGQDHHSYSIRMKAIIKAFGYNHEILHIILYQLVSLKESGSLIKMSKRKGKIISLKDIISFITDKIHEK